MMLAGLTAAALAAQVRVPGGRTVDSQCITTLPNNAVYKAHEAKPCSAASKVSAAQIQIYAADVEYKSTENLTSFTADWVVPPLPARSSFFRQTVYFWPGFKSQHPDMGYPVLQPVLQYGYEKYWQLQSWFVDGNNPDYPVVTAPAFKVNPGDKLTSFMTLSEDKKTWTVSGVSKTTGESSVLNIAFQDAGDCGYDWAMLVNENIDVDTACDLMPATTNLTFTNITVNGAVPKWTVRSDCAGNKECDCHNGASVAANGDVTISWQP